ncbi:cell division protein ZapA [Alicyclobacillus contaminans]|uniref:cell division protein ZapA n=1 Tax=Alicyclobacillus contaminans TaxID=392016 RepID=UPI00041E0C20|nr:cell division protein ZapA [Alicyclobacillus contaminans]GMA51909.1 cell division protein ZapA [Alicyclobacillus contaminans]
MSGEAIHRVRVQIGGAEYVLRGSESEERLLAIAKTVDDTIQAVLRANPNLDARKVAVLAALNIAEELHELRDQYDSLLELLDEQTKSPSER